MGGRTCLRRRNNSILRPDKLKNMIEWHKRYIEYWKKKLNVSDYGVAWISFIKGIFVGLLIYHFFII